MRQQRCLMGFSAACVVSLWQHHKCGMKRLNNTEDEQQDNNHQGDSQQPHNESWYHAVAPFSRCEVHRELPVIVIWTINMRDSGDQVVESGFNPPLLLNRLQFRQ
jgi:hypothetical protein